MKKQSSMGSKIFNICNYLFLGISGLLCVLPFINLLAISFSGTNAVNAGIVRFWPVDFTLKSYEFVINNPAFLKAAFVSVQRVFLGVSLNMILTILVAYPLSKEKTKFKWRGFYAWFFMITILISGGLIPTYMIIKYTGLLDTIWALVLPGALPVFNMVVLLNFFRALPIELEEAASIDGASHWTTLWKIYIPLSKAALATVTLFCIVGHWNSWFDGLLYMNRPDHYPLQSYLQTVIIDPQVFMKNALHTSKDIHGFLNFINARTSKAAQLFIGALPVLLVYPFLQRYFTTGLVLGSVKG